MDIEATWHCAHGERVDHIAFKYYNDEKYGADILSANPQIVPGVPFAGGETIYLPVVNTTEDSLEETAPWRD